MMKKVMILFLIMIITIGFTFCEEKNYQVPLSQTVDRIVKIELMENVNTSAFPPIREVICEVPQNRYEELLADLLSLPCYKQGYEPIGDCGWWIVRITYEDGNMDLIGADGICYQTIDDTRFTTFRFKYKDFEPFFKAYVYELCPDYIAKWKQ